MLIYDGFVCLPVPFPETSTGSQVAQPDPEFPDVVSLYMPFWIKNSWKDNGYGLVFNMLVYASDCIACYIEQDNGRAFDKIGPYDNSKLSSGGFVIKFPMDKLGISITMDSEYNKKDTPCYDTRLDINQESCMVKC